MMPKLKIMPFAVAMSFLIHAIIVLFVSVVPGKDAAKELEYQRVQLIEDKAEKIQNAEPGGPGQPAPAQERRKRQDKTDEIKKARTQDIVPPAAPVKPENPPPQEEKTPTLATSVPVEPEPPSEIRHSNTQTAPAGTSPNSAPAENSQVSSRVGDGHGNGDENGDGNGDGDGNRAKPVDWKKAYKPKVLGEIRRSKKYPYAARKERMEGRVVVRFTVLRSGELAGVSVVTPSEYSVLNSDAPDWIRRAAPFPPFPPEADEPSLSFTYGLKYILKD